MTTKHKVSYLSRKMNLFIDQVKSVSSGQFDGKAEVLSYMDSALKHYEGLWNRRKQILAARDSKNPNRVTQYKGKKKGKNS